MKGHPMVRRKILAGNWKMNKLNGDVAPFFKQLKDCLDKLQTNRSGANSFAESGPQVIFALPYTLLVGGVQSAAFYGYTVAAQNMHWSDSGAFTGEISASMLKDLGVGCTLIGHSERRQYFGETDETVAKKVKQALIQRVRPVVCVGETLEEREKGLTFEVIGRQLKSVFRDLGNVANLSVKDLATLVVAYEPVWAIGTGRASSAEDAQDVHSFIRKEAGSLRGDAFAQDLRILYGGSASPKNIKELLSKPDIDGALVGGASLVADDFAAMIAAAFGEG